MKFLFRFCLSERLFENFKTYYNWGPFWSPTVTLWFITYVKTTFKFAKMLVYTKLQYIWLWKTCLNILRPSVEHPYSIRSRVHSWPWSQTQHSWRRQDSADVIRMSVELGPFPFIFRIIIKRLDITNYVHSKSKLLFVLC